MKVKHILILMGIIVGVCCLSIMTTSTYLIAKQLTSIKWECINDNCETIGNQNQYVRDFTFISDSIAWAVGSDIWLINGEEWKTYPNPGGQLNAISCLSPINCWAVGDQKFTHRDGRQWNSVEIPQIPLEPMPAIFHFNDIAFANEEIGWIIGTWEQKNNYAGIIILEWDGVDWGKHILTIASPMDCFCSIAVNSSTDAWIVGSVSINSSISPILHWDGDDWNGVPLKDESIKSYSEVRISNEEVWITGDKNIRLDNYNKNWYSQNYLLHLIGKSWEIIELPEKYKDKVITAMVILSSGEVFVGGNFTALWTGNNWKDISFPKKDTLLIDMEENYDGVVWGITIQGMLLKIINYNNQN